MLNLLISHVVLRATVYELRRVMRISRESPRWKIGGGETLVTKNYFCNRYKNFVTVTNVFLTKIIFFTEIPTSHYRRFLQF
jgi:hypothetical protein